MEILTQIQEQLQQHPGTGSSIVLAQALAAAWSRELRRESAGSGISARQQQRQTTATPGEHRSGAGLRQRGHARHDDLVDG